MVYVGYRWQNVPQKEYIESQTAIRAFIRQTDKVHKNVKTETE